jgi:hypothetical protein
MSKWIWQFLPVFPILTGCAILVGGLWYPRSFAVVLADLDGDGFIDAYVGNGHTDDTGEPDTIWLNDGEASFKNTGQKLEDPCCSSNDTRAVVLADLNRNGYLDAVTATHVGSYNAIWINDGNGTFKRDGQKLYHRDSTNNTSGLAIGDINGDGFPDIVTGDCCRVTIPPQEGHPNLVIINPFILLWLNDGQGRFTDSGQRLGPQDTHALALGDLNGNGHLDLVAAVHGDRSQVWINDGQANFTLSQTALGIGNAQAVALGDIDGDGDLDVFIGNAGDNTLWLNDGSGNFSRSHQRLGTGNTQLVALVDLNQDGFLDAFIANPTGAEVWLNDGSGSFTRSRQRITYPARYVTALGDIDHDGTIDILATSYSGDFRIWLNDGKASFKERK